MHVRRVGVLIFRIVLSLVALLIVGTVADVGTPALSLRTVNDGAERFQVLDRSGKPLGVSYRNRFNSTDIVPLHDMPDLLRQAFVTSEDKKFFVHRGVDWRARLGAMEQNIRARRIVRGASTITEQVVRILHPRPRNLWSRWIEGFEAILLERHAGKGEILEFYLNQVPYAANRRGVVQAARYYFNRDLDTLTHKEMLALAILPRAPSALDLYKNPEAIESAIARLAQAMEERGELTPQAHRQLLAETIRLEPPAGELATAHFINYIRETVPYRVSDNGVLRTTLDGALQRRVQAMLDERIGALKRKQVHNGAALVVDHTTGEILAWAIGGAGDATQATPAVAIDAVRAPRQPGSALKPFLYALALDAGWSPATELDDAPMAEAIGSGLHDFHNYSHTFYGKISLREALGNSLNIPALETIGFVGPARYLDTLHALGFESLTRPVQYYKEGLALGTGEVTLLEMVQAYSALAERGLYRPLTPLPQTPFARKTTRVYTPEAASLIANILSDPYARRREFGAGSVLNLPVQTAVKTGTSTDYRDAWVMGFDSRYTVGVWLGNLDQTPMDGVTGSTGPALVLRGIFAALADPAVARPLYLSPKLVPREICAVSESAKSPCFPHTEYFIPGTEPKQAPPVKPPHGLTLVRPTEGLQIAYDPRIPAEAQAFEFVADGAGSSPVEWWIDDRKIGESKSGRFLWPVARGHHLLAVRQIDAAHEKIIASDSVHFNVK